MSLANIYHWTTAQLERKVVHYPLFWLVFVGFAAIIVTKGVLPALSNARGDFANYYTAARLIADGESLEPAYRDFTWFQKQMDRYGIERQVGGFIPHPPPTALVLRLLAGFDPLTAKRIWIIFNVILVVINVYFLSRIVELPWLVVAVLFLGTGSGLLNNFLFGQQYLLLTASIVSGLYLHKRGHPVGAGILLGSMVPVKYVGGLFLAYFVWKRQWSLLISAAITIGAGVALSLWLIDSSTFQTFLFEVMPRHLRGEIQDPYAVLFQSWNSLVNRLFLFEPTLNPQPIVESPLLAFLFKNTIFWVWIGVFVLVLRRARFSQPQHQQWFELGFIPMALLLISPGSATYHFLLLTLSVVLFVKLLLDQQRPWQALVLGGWFVWLNLPHYARLVPIANGWLAPLGYSRLWSLAGFFFLTLFLLRDSFNWSLEHKRAKWIYGLACLLLITISTARNYQTHRAEARDGAQWVPVDSPEFNHHLGVILEQPDAGTEEIVFSYCLLLDDAYAIFSAQGARWTPEATQNFYNPDLAADERLMLTESIANGRAEVWLYDRATNRNRFLTIGQNPRWGPNTDQFVFIRDGQVFEAGIAKPGHAVALSPTEPCYDLSSSPSGRFLAYVAAEPGGTSLRVYDRDRAYEHVVLRSSLRLETPSWSPDEQKLLFTWNRSGNRDIWGIDVKTERTRQLTHHRAADKSPVWDTVRQRILFTSDRDRGLGCRTLYLLPIPAEWQ